MAGEKSLRPAIRRGLLLSGRDWHPGCLSNHTHSWNGRPSSRPRRLGLLGAVDEESSNALEAFEP